jgi:predicted transglutaminase-like cysteine proteinase
MALCATLLTGLAGCTGAGLPETARLGGTRSPVPPPPGYHVYCDEYASQDEACRAILSEEGAQELQRINAAVNARIRPGSDTELYGAGDRWVMLDGAGLGDCDDYAVTKLHELVRSGWPRGALRLTLAEIPGGGPHLVLVVSTVAGDYVLDNRFDRVMAVGDLDYRWVSQEMPGHPHWVSLLG